MTGIHDLTRFTLHGCSYLSLLQDRCAFYEEKLAPNRALKTLVEQASRRLLLHADTLQNLLAIHTSFRRQILDAIPEVNPWIRVNTYILVEPTY